MDEWKTLVLFSPQRKHFLWDILGVLVVLVTKTYQVELKSGRVEDPGKRHNDVMQLLAQTMAMVEKVGSGFSRYLGGV